MDLQLNNTTEFTNSIVEKVVSKLKNSKKFKNLLEQSEKLLDVDEQKWDKCMECVTDEIGYVVYDKIIDSFVETKLFDKLYNDMMDRVFDKIE